MTSVWVLVALSVNYGFLTPTKVHVDTLVFQTAEECLRNIDNVKAQLLPYDEISVNCVEKSYKKVNKL